MDHRSADQGAGRPLKVMSVFGTRPEAIKMAPLVKELERREEFESYCCVTAQHRQMLDGVLEIFQLKPQFDLDIMEPRQTLSTITSKCLLGLEKVFEQLRPDLVLVHGDTSTTFAGALAAFYQKITIGHVEAGLRTGDKYSPFPEEMNRSLVGRLADLHFCPTWANRANLEREGISEGVYVTMEQIMTALRLLAQRYSDEMELIYPVHLSPVVQEAAHRHLDGLANVHLIQPLAVDEMHNLMARSYLVMTDSGGLQEEAPALGKPVLVLRQETERPEAVEAGTVKIAGVETGRILNLAEELMDSPQAYREMAHAVNPYGDGQACRRIADAIAFHFGYSSQRPGEFQPRG